MTITTWLQILALGSACGAIGQVARMVVGLKKLNDEAASRSERFRDLLEGNRILVSVAIGAVAGALAALLTVVDPSLVSLEQVLSLAAAGYAGSDFIEGITSRFLPTGARATERGTAATTEEAESIQPQATHEEYLG